MKSIANKGLMLTIITIVAATLPVTLVILWFMSPKDVKKSKGFFVEIIKAWREK